MQLPSDSEFSAESSSTFTGLSTENNVALELDYLKRQNRRLQLENEIFKNRLSCMNKEMQRQKQQNIQNQIKLEEEEEFISNKLMREIYDLKSQIGKLNRCYDVEQDLISESLNNKMEILNYEKSKMNNVVDLQLSNLSLHNNNNTNTNTNSTTQKRVNSMCMNTCNSGTNSLQGSFNQSISSLANLQMDSPIMSRAPRKKPLFVNHIEHLERQVVQKQMQLDELKNDKVRLTNILEQEQEKLMNHLFNRLKNLQTDSCKIKESMKEQLDASMDEIDYEKLSSMSSMNLANFVTTMKQKLNDIKNSVGKLDEQSYEKIINTLSYDKKKNIWSIDKEVQSE